MQELSKYYNLLQRIHRAEEILAGLQSAAVPGAQVLNGMPHTPGVKDRLGDLAAEIMDMQRLIWELEQQAGQETIKLQNETKILEAEAAAKAKIIEAEGEAEANKIISQSLTEQLIKKMEMEARQQHGWVTVQGANTVVTE